jgi:hypothetical protein
MCDICMDARPKSTFTGAWHIPECPAAKGSKYGRALSVPDPGAIQLHRPMRDYAVCIQGGLVPAESLENLCFLLRRNFDFSDTCRGRHYVQGGTTS